MKKLLLSLIFATFAGSAFAQDLSFNNISDDDLKKIMGDFSANFAFTPVAAAGPLGAIFGFEFGLIAGMTSTPEIDKFVKEVDANAKANQFPHAALVGRVSVPFGITVGLNMVPSLKAGDSKFSSMGAEFQWALSDGFLVIPFDLAIRGNISNTTLEFVQDQPVADQKVEVSTGSTALQVVAGLDLIFIEPYIGFGQISTNGKFDVGTAGLFSDDPSASSRTVKPTSSQMLLGVAFNLPLFHLGLEYASMYDTSRYTAKLAFGF